MFILKDCVFTVHLSYFVVLCFNVQRLPCSSLILQPCIATGLTLILSFKIGMAWHGLERVGYNNFESFNLIWW